MKERILGATFYGFLDLVCGKLLRMVGFVLLARLLEVDSIGVIGMAEGFLAVLGYMEFSFVSVIYREEEEAPRSTIFSAAAYFWMAQTSVMLLLTLVAGLVVAGVKDNPLLLPVMIGQAVSFALMAGTDICRAFFGLDLRQGLIFKVNLVLGLISLASLLLLLNSPGIKLYIVLLVANSLVGGVVWLRLVFRQGIEMLPLNAVREIIWPRFRQFAVWNHLNKSAYDFALMIDAFILGFFAGWREVGNYTMALKLTSMLLIIPALISNMVTILLRRIGRGGHSDLLVSYSVKYGVVLSLIQLLLLIGLGRPIIKLLFPSGRGESIFLYALLICVGTVFLNAGKPLQSLITVRGDLKRAFREVYLPLLLCTLVSYGLFAWRWGAMGTAAANIIVYGLTGLLVARHVRFKGMLRWERGWFTGYEREWVLSFRRRAAAFIRRCGT